MNRFERLREFVKLFRKHGFLSTSVNDWMCLRRVIEGREFIIKNNKLNTFELTIDGVLEMDCFLDNKNTTKLLNRIKLLDRKNKIRTILNEITD